MVVLLFVLGAFLVFQKYIVRAVAGRWHSVAASFSDGKIYDVDKTIKCAVDTRFPDIWYEEECFEANCVRTCFNDDVNLNACQACITNCSAAEGGICQTGG